MCTRSIYISTHWAKAGRHHTEVEQLICKERDSLVDLQVQNQQSWDLSVDKIAKGKCLTEQQNQQSERRDTRGHLRRLEGTEGHDATT